MNVTDVTRTAGGHRRRRRIGRGNGSGWGKTAGRGHKGQGSRAGWSQRGLQEGGQMPIFRRLPKRGFTNAPFKKVFSVVNVGDLEERFDGGAHVTPQALKEQGLIRHLRHPVKILGEGELTKKLKVDAAQFSRSALEKINGAGGEARITGRRGEVVPATMPEPKKKDQPEAQPKGKGKDAKAKGDKAKADKGGDSKAKGDKKKAEEKPADAGAAEAKPEAGDGAKAEDAAPKDEQNEQTGEDK